MKDIAITVKDVEKIYRLYENPLDRLKEALNIVGRKYHREHFALREVSFDVEQGETIGIIGTNGSGKSTLLKILTGVLTQTSGEVKINGKISALLELGAGFNMEYTGIENIYLNGTISGYTREEMDSKIEEILKFADIGDFVYQPVKTYSSGMFVRLAFAVAINVEPDILIIDEALSVGDNIFQAKCYKKFEELKNKGKTILLVTHDVDSVRRFCDRCIWLDKGIIKEIGEVEQVTGHYIAYTSNKVKIGQDVTKLKSTSENKCREKKFEPIARWGSSPDAIKYVSIVNRRNKDVEYIDKDEAIKITMDIQLSEAVVNEPCLGLAFSIKSTKGQDLIVGSTFAENYIFESPGYYSVTFEMKNYLVPGEYYIVASLETRQLEVPTYIDYIDGAYYFKIGSKNVYYGMLDVPMNISINQLD